MQELRFPPGFFGASVVAAWIQFVSAISSGEEFSNNLISDVAPILTQFGEQVTCPYPSLHYALRDCLQVAKQYRSQSTSWVEDVVIAYTTLGILTTIVRAIRVGGATWMKAIVGHARESEGAVKVELMTSTSSDVCELQNSQGVIRVLGSSPIIKL